METDKGGGGAAAPAVCDDKSDNNNNKYHVKGCILIQVKRNTVELQWLGH